MDFFVINYHHWTGLWGFGPMWGLGGPVETKFSNFNKGLFLALGCLFLDPTNF